MHGREDKSYVETNIDYSKRASQLGWKYFAKGDVDTAIKRFNQAWMFDHENAVTLMGVWRRYGRECEHGEPIKNLKESLRFLKMAKSITPNNARLTADLAYSYILLGRELQIQNQEDEYSIAYQILNEAKEMQPNFFIICFNFSLFEFYKENYSKAKDFLATVESLGFVVDPSYNEALNEKL